MGKFDFNVLSYGLHYLPFHWSIQKKNIWSLKNSSKLLLYWTCKLRTWYLLTYSKEQSPSWEANRFSVSQEFPRILWNPEVHYHIHNCQPTAPILSQHDPVHTAKTYFLKLHLNILMCDKGVPVTTAWRVLRLRTEQRPPVWRVDANILNKQSRTADKELSSSLGVGRGANNSSPLKRIQLHNIYERDKLGKNVTTVIKISFKYLSMPLILMPMSTTHRLRYKSMVTCPYTSNNTYVRF